MAWNLRGEAAVVGIGRTEFSRASGRSVADLAVAACRGATEDAGVDLQEVDGIICYGLNDSVHPQTVASAFGLSNLRYNLNLFGGGNICVATVAYAAAAINAGLASNVLIFRALNGRSGHRLGGGGREQDFFQARDEAQYTYPFGWFSYPQYIAMSARRHMIKYGSTSEDLAHIAVTMRANAVDNPRAVMRKPISFEEHQASRMIADPLRLFDVCLETDGACAVLVTSADRAQDTRHGPIFLLGAATGGVRRPGFAFDGFFMNNDMADLYAGEIAVPLWKSAGLGPEDMDIASIYDCFTFSVLSQLEGLGFCRPGEGGAFVRDGNIGLKGTLPVNTGGGMLSEAYVHGLNGLVELVEQLRGGSGIRQVKGAHVGVATGFGVTTGCAIVLADSK